MNTDVEVRESPIHEKGVFALRNFESGDVVLMWDTSHVVDEKGIDLLSDAQKRFLARFQGKWIIMQEPMRYVNHSCEPNTRSQNGTDIAILDIQKGDEITSDYRPEMKAGERMECHCGAKSCAGYIIGTAA